VASCAGQRVRTRRKALRRAAGTSFALKSRTDQCRHRHNESMARVETDPVRQQFDQALGARSMNAYWRRVSALQRLGTRDVFEIASTSLESRDARRRRLGANVLSELGYQRSSPPFRSQSAQLLLTALKREKNPSVLAAIVTALGRLRLRLAIPSLVPLAKHRSPEVRRALAAELPWCTWDSGEEKPGRRVTATLINLACDPIAEVRDWACFGLASSGADSPEVRDSLWNRVRDRHYDTRIEALRGLARRRDPRVRQALHDTLRVIGSSRLGTWVMDDLVEYAKSVRDRHLARVLES